MLLELINFLFIHLFTRKSESKCFNIDLENFILSVNCLYEALRLVSTLHQTQTIPVDFYNLHSNLKKRIKIK